VRKADRDAAFTEYVAARRTELRRLAFALCGSWDRAEDMLQNALVKLYVAWPRVEAAHNQDAYVRRAVLNAVVDESRRPWRRESPVDEVGDRVAPAAEETPDFAAALALLPTMQRKVVVLRHWLDLSVEETAAELGIAEGTVKSHHHRAMTRLRECLTAKPHEARSTP
jgi:RNA polymerase sigma-70 factor (sigma-E family)